MVSNRTHLQFPVRCSSVIRNLLVACLVAACFIVLADVAAACPTCKDGIAENDPGRQAMAAGYFYSIIFMLTMPFAILGTFGSLAYFSIRKARLEQEAASTEDVPEDI